MTRRLSQHHGSSKRRQSTKKFDITLPKLLVRLIRKGLVTDKNTITVAPDGSWREWMIDGKRLRDFGDMSHKTVHAPKKQDGPEPEEWRLISPDDVDYQDKLISLSIKDSVVSMEGQSPPPRPSFSEVSSPSRMASSPLYRPGERLLTSKEVCELLNVSLSTLHRLRKMPDFPEPIEFNSRNKRWSYGAVRFWITRNRDKLVSLVAKP